MAMTKDRWLLVAILASCVVAGLAEPHLPNPGQPFNEVGVAHSLVLAVLLFAWCREDAASRGVNVPNGAPLLVAIISPVGIPYYFFRALPWRKAIRACLLALGFVAVAVAVTLAASYVSVAI
jgi:hypothetical protein